MSCRWWTLSLILTFLVPALAAAQADEPRSSYGSSDVEGDVDYGGVTLGYGAERPKFDEDIYRIVRGDTLWGICGRFFGDPETWPGLWSINNEEITNPHYIYPGQVIRFQPGTDIRPPIFTVGEVGPEDYAYEEAFLNIVSILADQRECGVAKPFRLRDYRYRVSAPGFIVSDPRDKDDMQLGEVYASKEIGTLLGLEQTAYLQYEDDTVEDVHCGDIYTIYREVHDVRHPYVRRARVGTLYQVVGEVLITDVNLRTGVATSKVIDGWDPVMRGDMIADRVPVSSLVSERQVQGQVEGYIIDRLVQDASLMQSREVLFIDRGRNSGVEPGTVFWVMRRDDPLARTARERKKIERLPLFVVGKLVVYSVDDNHATAVLVDGAQNVSIGDRVYTVVEEAEMN